MPDLALLTPDTNSAEALGADLPTPDTSPPPHPKFPRDTTGFHAELKRRVAAYFAAGRSERDCWQMYLKTAIILAWLGTSYVLLVFVADSWWQALPLAYAMVLGVAGVGFAIQHDGGHHAYSRYEWINRLAALSMDMIGASSYLWRWKHVVMHHTYPNVAGEDMDIDGGGLTRFTPNQPWRWFHRWQHLYLWPAYAITAPRWHLWGDFKELLTGKIGPHPIPRPRGKELAIFVVGKTFSIITMLILPMLFHPWWLVLAFYLLVTGLAGVFLTVVFQLAHCVGEADFPTPIPDTARMPDAWAAHQVMTTVDFARRSWSMTFLLGGLNFQIEHHLFPRICHIHYPALSKIVEETSREYGVRYTNHGSFWAGIRAHYRWLKELGNPEPTPPAIEA